MTSFNLFGIDCLDDPELPADLFTKTLQEMADDDKRLLYIPSERIQYDEPGNAVIPELSNLAYFDASGPTLYMGLKEAEKPKYTVYNDVRPAQEVFRWTEKYFSGQVKEFPLVTVAEPLIPHSRYDKGADFLVLDQYMIAKGFRILNPTIQQKDMYPEDCDEDQKVEMEVDIIPGREILAEEQLRDWLRQDLIWKMYGKGKRRQVICRSQSAWLHVHANMHHILTVPKSTPKSMRRSKTIKYFARRYLREYDSSENLIVGMDFNPYSPYGAQDLQSVVMESNGVLYTRRWKDDSITGFYYHDAKRYYSDIWYPEVYSPNVGYNKALMSLDMVTNSYSGVEAVMFSRPHVMKLLAYPLLIEPFITRWEYNKKVNPIRAPIHYKLSNMMAKFQGQVYIPYSTARSKSMSQPEKGVDVVGMTIRVQEVNKIIIQGPVRSEEVGPVDFFEFVKSRVTYYNRGMINEQEYLQYVQSCSQYFVHQETCVEKRKLKYKRGFRNVSRIRYKIYRRVNDDKGFECEYVPYAILRYPHNRWGTLVPNMMVFTLEQFLSQYVHIRAKWKAPVWIYKIECDAAQLEFDWEGMEDLALLIDNPVELKRDFDMKSYMEQNV
jgi:hypothetical protein